MSLLKSRVTTVRFVFVYNCSLPGGVTIVRFLGLCDKSCLACGKVVKVKDSADVYTCSTQNCTGHISIQVKEDIAFNIKPRHPHAQSYRD